MTPRIPIPNLHVEIPNTTQLRQWMKIPTQFKDEMEQAELHSPQLVNIEVCIYPFFLNMKTELGSGSHHKQQTKREKTIPQDYRRCLSCQSL